MFKFTSARFSVPILLAMAVQIHLALSSPPLFFNPLFFVASDERTIWLAQVTFKYLLVPAHCIEAVVALVLAFNSGKHSDEILSGFEHLFR
jgi:hypothetical protein